MTLRWLSTSRRVVPLYPIPPLELTLLAPCDAPHQFSRSSSLDDTRIVSVGAAKGVCFEPPTPPVPFPSWACPLVFFNNPEDCCHVDVPLDLLVTPPLDLPYTSALNALADSFRPVDQDMARPSLHHGRMPYVSHSGRGPARPLRCESRANHRSPP